MSRKEAVLKLLDSQHHALVFDVLDYIDRWSNQFNKSLDIYVASKVLLSGDISEALIITGFLNDFVLRIELSSKFYLYTIPAFAENISYTLESNHRSQNILDISNDSLQYTTLVYEIANILTESQKS